MPNYTTNLNLLKKDPATEGNDYFNIETMLNENWDKIDTDKKVQDDTLVTHDAEIVSLQSEVQNSVASGEVSLSNTTLVTSIDAKVNGGLNFEMEASPLVVNAGGSVGDCENTTNFIVASSTIALDSTTKVFGNNSIILTSTVEATNPFVTYADTGKYPIDAAKYYLVTAYIRNIDASSVHMRTYKGSTLTQIGSLSDVITGTIFTRVGIKLQPSDLTGETSIRPYIRGISNGIGTRVAVDGIMVNEITADEYSNLTVDQLLAKYPYVNSIQPMMGLDIKAVGENLVRNGNCEEGINYWTPYNSQAKLSIENGMFKLVTTMTGVGVYQKRKVKPNTDYYLSGNVSGSTHLCILTAVTGGINIRDYVGTFNTGSNLVIYLYMINNQIGTGYADHISLIEGTVAPAEYKPYDEAELLIDGEFVGIDSYRDKLSYKNARVRILRKVEKIVLDGDLAWNFNADAAGFKTIKLSIPDSIAYQAKIMKYDGKIVHLNGSVSSSDTFNLNSYLYLGITDADSGWGEDYTPTAAEIKALMNGWKMNNGTFGNPYNGAGIKTWTIWDATDNTGAVSVCPTTKADGWTAWATLWYALVTPIEEVLDTPINGLGVFEGKTTISLATGVVKEKANPMYHIGMGYYYINNNESSIKNCAFIYKTRSIICILKNRADDTYNWTIRTSASPHINGIQDATISPEKYDPTATYEVIYEVLHEEYDSQQVTLTAEYTENLRDNHNELVKTVNNIQVDVSDIEANLITVTDDVIAHVTDIVAQADGGHVKRNGTTITGSNANAEGNLTTASGTSSHAEGGSTIACGPSSHAEGGATVASGSGSHAEGYNNVASGDYSHVEGSGNTVSGYDGHGEGYSVKVIGSYAHAEGYGCAALAPEAHAEGSRVTAGHGTLYKITAFSGQTITLDTVTGLAVNDILYMQDSSQPIGITAATITAIAGLVLTVSGATPIQYWSYALKPGTGNYGSHGEGYLNWAVGKGSHAEGYSCIASGDYSHAENNGNIVSGAYSHAEGANNTVSSANAHAEGNANIVSADTSHAEGANNTVSGQLAHAEGYHNVASGSYSYVRGAYNQARYVQTSIGQYGTISTASDTAFSATAEALLIGNGNGEASRGLAFKVMFDGKTYADGAYASTGADYAEYFEWLDGNPDAEDRVGYFVTLDGDKIRRALAADTYVLGIVSVTPSIVGDNFEAWQGKYVTDDWGRVQYHDVTVPAVTNILHHKDEYTYTTIPAIIDVDGYIVEPEKIEQTLIKEAYDEVIEILPERVEKQPIYNPDWNPAQEYVSREHRKEWSAIGMMGKLLVRDDGTCVMNGFCMPNNDGIATNSISGYRVMKRVADNIIQVLVK